MMELTWIKGLVALGGIIAGIVVAVLGLLQARTKVQSAQAAALQARAKRDEAEAALAENKATAGQRLSIPPGELDVLQIFRAELRDFKDDMLRRLDSFSARLTAVDAAHDGTRDRVAKIEGRMNGHGKKE